MFTIKNKKKKKERKERQQRNYAQPKEVKF